MWYDGLMLAILAFTTIRGAAKGMAWQLAAIAALVLCFVFATPLSLVVAPSINLTPPLNRWVAMLAIYLAFSFGCFAIARLLRGWLEELKFTEYDRHLGALFGLLKGATLCLVITFFAVCLSESACHAIMQTRSGYIAGEVLEQLQVVMPAELQTVLRPHLRHFDDDHLAMDAHSTPEEDAEPWNDRDEGDRGDQFRGSVLPDRDALEDIDRPDRDADEPAEKAEAPANRGIVGQAVDALEKKFKASVKGWISDTLNPGAAESQRGSETAHSHSDSDRSDSHRNPAAAAESVPSLVTAVARLFSTNPQKQADRKEQIEALLQGIPAPIAAAALRDWRADLLGADSDPDPETDAESSLDLRLLRQLKAAGHSLDDLARPVRERLRDADWE